MLVFVTKSRAFGVFTDAVVHFHDAGGLLHDVGGLLHDVGGLLHHAVFLFDDVLCFHGQDWLIPLHLFWFFDDPAVIFLIAGRSKKNAPAVFDRAPVVLTEPNSLREQPPCALFCDKNNNSGLICKNSQPLCERV